MAIQLKTVTTKYGIDANDVYVRVENVSLPDKNTIIFLACLYAKQNFPPFANPQFSCHHEVEGENVLKQAYLHLKTLTEFADAIDC